MQNQFNPMESKLYPWQVAVARRSFVTFVTLPIIWSEAFFKTWHEVYRG